MIRLVVVSPILANWRKTSQDLGSSATATAPTAPAASWGRNRTLAAGGSGVPREPHQEVQDAAPGLHAPRRCPGRSTQLSPSAWRRAAGHVEFTWRLPISTSGRLLPGRPDRRRGYRGSRCRRPSGLAHVAVVPLAAGRGPRHVPAPPRGGAGRPAAPGATAIKRAPRTAVIPAMTEVVYVLLIAVAVIAGIGAAGLVNLLTWRWRRTPAGCGPRRAPAPRSRDPAPRSSAGRSAAPAPWPAIERPHEAHLPSSRREH
jgi:hypothetical protein